MNSARNAIDIVTPEEVALRMPTATWHARLVAFAVDMIGMALVIGLAILAVNTLIAASADAPESTATTDVAASLHRLMAFVGGTFYFIYFELKWHGQTPGKRLMRLRVVMRDGGPLDTGSIVARNLTRDLETMLPLLAILNPAALGIDGGPRIVLFWIWLVALAALPLLNPRHLRLGDLVGRTAVIALPRAVLLDDLSQTTRATSTQSHIFSPAQLALYGSHELQVLENLLRHHAITEATEGLSLVTNVAIRIARRIDWHPPGQPDMPVEMALGRHEAARAFLQAFYDAQRTHLEGRLLLGERR